MRPSPRAPGGVDLGFDLRIDLRPLTHPLWWGALALLLANDRLFKGSGLLPGWLTGKLSDFAFLVVAPVLLCALLPVGLRARRGIALAVVAATYAAADLSPAFSEGLVRAAARIGLAWRLWPDVTDLVALAVLPLAWRIARAGAARASAPRLRLVAERAGLAVGALACLATSAPPGYLHWAFLTNRTKEAVTVTASWRIAPQNDLDCTQPLAEVAARLGPGHFAPRREIALEPGGVAPLDAPPRAADPATGRCSNVDETGVRIPSEVWNDGGTQGASSPDAGAGFGPLWACSLVRLEVAGVAPVLVRAPTTWEESDPSFFFPDEPKSACRMRLDPARSPGPDAVSIVERRGRRELVAGKKVELVTLPGSAM